MDNALKVIISPLDWGLGHCTRSIPIIHALQRKGCEVYVAVTLQQKALLLSEVKGVRFIDFDGYNVRYPYQNMLLSMLLQFPTIAKTIKNEKLLLDKLIKQHNIDGIISDNRFGFYSKRIPSVYITHQIQIQTPWYLSSFKKALLYFHKRVIKNFDFCWIPDWASSPNLTGELSKVNDSGDKFQFVGLLSRMKRLEDVEQDLDVLAVMSGPEPQRSMFEKLVMQQLIKTGLKFCIVRGLPEEYNESWNEDDMFINHLQTVDLNRFFLRANLIISRSGYSSVMDIAKTGRKSAFVPTPGQTEQLYLADYYAKQKWCYYEEQDYFDVKNMVNMSKRFTGLPQEPIEKDLLDKAIDRFIEAVKLRKYSKSRN